MDAGAGRAVREAEICEAGSCSGSAVIALAGQDYCLKHFLAQCYERLHLLESTARAREVDSAWVRSARTLLEECSNQTLRVCLRHQPLNNLERSRLLDILLFCGELQQILRSPLLDFRELDARDSARAVPRGSDLKQN